METPPFALLHFSDEDDDLPSLVEKIFPDPETVSQGEYYALYEFLLAPDIRNDPNLMASVLEEFAGWAKYMLTRMQVLGLVSQ